MAEVVIIYTDGGSRGNPGPAAAGFVIQDKSGKDIYAKGQFLGEATNNVAEYTALLLAVEKARELGAVDVKVFSDSELMVRQITGRYKVKNETLKTIHSKCIKILNEFDDWSIEHLLRNKNAQADELVNKALDKKGDVEYLSTKTSADTDSKQQAPIKLAVLISGSGTTMLNILKYIKAGSLNAEIKLVISSRSKAGGVEKAKKAGLNVKIIRKKDFPDIASFSEQIKKELLASGADLVIQGGWLCLWKIPKEFKGRVMNIHPALLPSFGGKGMWGHHVHQAVIDAGCKVSGCTVHFCTNEYDDGPIIIQKTCPVEAGDSPEDLAERVFQTECAAYPKAIKLFAQGRITIKGKVTKIS
ncbi:MAG: phosphoribosylglycinamide formyltransferase [Anaerohalosphaeraceae bacterium]|nr:phosphoribosylglycinamide formyltransferase [Anaerohalosphaeraceae bacterium]